MWFGDCSFFFLFFIEDCDAFFVDFCTLTIPYTITWFYKVIFCIYFASILVFCLPLNEQLKVIIITLIDLLYFYVSNKYLNFSPYLFATTLNFPFGMILAYLCKHNMKNCKLLCVQSIILFGLSIHYCSMLPLVFYSMAFSICCICICSFVDIRNKLFKYIGDNSLLFYLFHIAILYPIQHSIRNNYVVLSLFLFLLPFIFVFFVQES